MTERVRKMLEWYRLRTYRELRTDKTPDMSEKIQGKRFADAEAAVLCAELEAQHPILYEGDIFGFHQSIPATCGFDGVVSNTGKEYRGYGGNITIDHEMLLKRGLDDILDEIESRYDGLDERGKLFFGNLAAELHAILKFCRRYESFAREKGVTVLADALRQVPGKPPRSYYEALLFQKIIMFSMRLCPTYHHITLGRFDKYMYPYFEADLKKGVGSEELFELTELYFIDLNFDSDTYVGLQQGDNGQSMVLGGYDKDGTDMYNELSSMCMKASEELLLIDPKINLRVNGTTPLERYIEATELTAKGLGFPQYSNDDVVVPGLIALGYDEEDARDYAVAACWEFIIPGKGADIVNLSTVDYPRIVGKLINDGLAKAETFDDLLDLIEPVFCEECAKLVNAPPSYFSGGPMFSMTVDGCIEKAKMLDEGAAKYNNRGFHGAGIANAADALAAVGKVIYEDKSATKEELLDALKANFEGYDSLRRLLRDAPKMGNDEDAVDLIAVRLMTAAANNINGKKSGNGICRLGTGSAQGYIEVAKYCPATADGRRAGEPYSSSYSPSLDVRLNGPLSVIRSFTKFDLTKAINGGPLTIEMHDTVFRNSESKQKAAALVKLFIDRGGHQLQINAINRDTLIDAKAHPELYPDLIVRVWGWSGYFVELSESYQDHIIRRTEFSV